MDCLSCGLLDKKVNPYLCLRFNKEIHTEETNADGDCIYYLKEVFEDGELLTPIQHLIMQDQDLRSKKMQGPIR